MVRNSTLSTASDAGRPSRSRRRLRAPNPTGKPTVIHAGAMLFPKVDDDDDDTHCCNDVSLGRRAGRRVAVRRSHRNPARAQGNVEARKQHSWWSTRPDTRRRKYASRRSSRSARYRSRSLSCASSPSGDRLNSISISCPSRPPTDMPIVPRTPKRNWESNHDQGHPRKSLAP